MSRKQPKGLRAILSTKTLVAAMIVATGCLTGCQGSGRYVETATIEPVRTAEARGYNKRAVEAYQEQDLEEALDLVDKALEADPRFGPAFNTRGMVYLEQDDPYRAAVAFQEAARLMPHHVEPLNNLGLVMERVGRLKDAIEQYEMALIRDAQAYEVRANLARARLMNGEEPKDLQKLLEGIAMEDPRGEWREWAEEATRYRAMTRCILEITKALQQTRVKIVASLCVYSYKIYHIKFKVKT
jgi:Tfp pilus assembly protein PilF